MYMCINVHASIYVLTLIQDGHVTCQGGYDCELVEKPPSSVQHECPVCLLVLREPYQVSCCGYCFCKAYIENIKDSSKPVHVARVRSSIIFMISD